MTDDMLERETLRKVAWRLIPFVCVLYVLNILDRSNIGFARLQMQQDLGLSDATSNWGYSIFYVGYLLFEVPSNLLLRRFGARRWMARIMITWGIVSALTMFARDVWTFFGYRILLGVAEAGFFPGIILYLSFWFPLRERAKMTAFFMAAVGLAGAIGNPLSGVIMQYLDNVAGLRGWQWLFLLEGLPSVLFGIAILFYLTDYPRDAHWLSDAERDWLVEHMEREHIQREQQHQSHRLEAMLQYRVWWLIAIYFTAAIASNAAGANFPTIIRKQFWGLSTVQVGLLSALPHLCAVIGMSLFGMSSDRRRERRWHLTAAAFLAAVGWTLIAWNRSPLVTLFGLCVAQVGMMSMLPIFWTLPTAFLTGAAAAGGIALINSLANFGGLFGPPTFALPHGRWIIAGILFVGSGLALALPETTTPDQSG